MIFLPQILYTLFLWVYPEVIVHAMRMLLRNKDESCKEKSRQEESSEEKEEVIF